MGPEALRYREIAEAERCRAAARQRGLPVVAGEAGDAPSAPYSAIAVVSPVAGVGKTTLSAHLCAALTARGARAVGVDLDPKGDLARALAPEHPCLAPGAGEILRLRAALAQGASAPQHLARELAASEADWEVLVLDTGPEPSAALELAAAASEAALVLVAPEVLEQLPAAVDRVAAALQPGARLLILMNGFDNRRADHRLAFAALRGAYGERVLPEPVHFDPAFRERFGRAPHSQAAADVERLARWLGQGSDAAAASGRRAALGPDRAARGAEPTEAMRALGPSAGAGRDDPARPRPAPTGRAA